MEDINKTTDVSSFPHWGEREGVQVFVAGPEHEVYVDTILQTIADAAKVRGTGIAKRTHEYLATKMKEAKAVIALASRQDFLADQRCCRDEVEHGTGLPTRDFCRSDRRRGILARLRGMRECGCAAPHGTEILHLHGDAVRPRGASARKDS